MSGQSEANKSAVRDFYNLAFNLRKPEEAVAKYVGSHYRQHNPSAGDGADPFITFVRGFVKAFHLCGLISRDSWRKAT